jgi:hypothetical protein
MSYFTGPHGYSRRDRKPFVLCKLVGDVERSFDDFDTYEEALAAAEADGYKAWIIGPDFLEDHS